MAETLRFDIYKYKGTTTNINGRIIEPVSKVKLLPYDFSGNTITDTYIFPLLSNTILSAKVIASTWSCVT